MKGGGSAQMNAGTVKSSLRSLFHRIRKSGKRQKLTILFALFIFNILLLSGIFAYFQSKDEVTNRYHAKNAVVRLLEPDWDSVGQNLAKASEPGMTIPKNPYAKNEGQNDLYIRLKIIAGFLFLLHLYI